MAVVTITTRTKPRSFNTCHANSHGLNAPRSDVNNPGYTSSVQLLCVCALSDRQQCPILDSFCSVLAVATNSFDFRHTLHERAFPFFNRCPAFQSGSLQVDGAQHKDTSLVHDLGQSLHKPHSCLHFSHKYTPNTEELRIMWINNSRIDLKQLQKSTKIDLWTIAWFFSLHAGTFTMSSALGPSNGHVPP